MNESHGRNKTTDSSMPLWYLRSRQSIYFALGVIQVLIGFHFIFRLLGANPDNGFVSFLYSISGIFTAPFSGIFEPVISPGLSARSVLEPAAIIAMAVYGILAWGLVSLIRISASKEL